MVTVTQTVLILADFYNLKDVECQVGGQLLVGRIRDLRVGHLLQKKRWGIDRDLKKAFPFFWRRGAFLKILRDRRKSDALTLRSTSDG